MLSFVVWQHSVITDDLCRVSNLPSGWSSGSSGPYSGELRCSLASRTSPEYSGSRSGQGAFSVVFGSNNA